MTFKETTIADGERKDQNWSWKKIVYGILRSYNPLV